MQPATRTETLLGGGGALSDTGEAITRAHREEWVRVVAGLARRFGDLDLAEEMAAEAFAVAAARWPVEGVPPNPGAWLTLTAQRKAIDHLRREATRRDRHEEAIMLREEPEPAGTIEDDRLRLIFTCCHPALSMEARVALTLRLVGGLTVPEIARAFFVEEAAMGKRITRAKAKIKTANIPYRVPDASDLPKRLDGVLAVLYLTFNEGYLASGGETAPVRGELTSEAIRLTRLLHGLMPDEGEAIGLLALMLLTEARRAARVTAQGRLVPLDRQDRSLWDRGLIEEGHRLLRERLASGEAPGRYQLLAAINAVHTSARQFQDTDWSQIVALYDQLVRVDPSPVVRLNRAVAVAEVDGPQVGLAEVEKLPLQRHHLFHAARAEMLTRLGRHREAHTAYERAIALARNEAQRSYLESRLGQLAE